MGSTHLADLHRSDINMCGYDDVYGGADEHGDTGWSSLDLNQGYRIDTALFLLNSIQHSIGNDHFVIHPTNMMICGDLIMSSLC